METADLKKLFKKHQARRQSQILGHQHSRLNVQSLNGVVTRHNLI